MDCDNEDNDSAENWITPFDVSAAFPGVAFAAVYSRNNMKQKSDKSPRPRFHVYFPVPEIKDAAEYSGLKQSHSIY